MKQMILKQIEVDGGCEGCVFKNDNGCTIDITGKISKSDCQLGYKNIIWVFDKIEDKDE